jgi:hypothetical protein
MEDCNCVYDCSYGDGNDCAIVKLSFESRDIMRQINLEILEWLLQDPSGYRLLHQVRKWNILYPGVCCNYDSENLAYIIRKYQMERTIPHNYGYDYNISGDEFPYILSDIYDDGELKHDAFMKDNDLIEILKTCNLDEYIHYFPHPYYKKYNLYTVHNNKVTLNHEGFDAIIERESELHHIKNELRHILSFR